MDQFILIWRFFPRLFMGIVFTTEISLLVFGKNLFSNFFIILYHQLAAQQLSGMVSIILLLIFICLTAYCGLLLLDLILAVFNFLANQISKKKLFTVLNHNHPIRALFTPIEVLAYDAFSFSENQIMEYLELRDLAENKLNIGKEYSKFTRKITDHMKNLTDYQIARIFDYHNSVAQEQRQYDIMSSQLKFYMYFCFVILVLPFCIFAITPNAFYVVIALIGSLIFLFIVLYQYVLIKRQFAIFLLAGYLSTFTVAESAEVIDRPGEPML